MDEFALIKKFFGTDADAKTPVGSGDVAQGCALSLGADGVITAIGDDCAVLELPAGKQLVVSIDTMLEGVHFPEGAPGFDVGTRVLCGALSDLAAMGAHPLWFTLALTLPRVSTDWLKAFSSGLRSVARQFNCTLVGGDTTKGPLCITVQVHGSVQPGASLLRSGAVVGDDIFVSECLGDGAAALALMNNQLEVDAAAGEYLLNRFYRPQPQILLGQQLVGIASAAIDVSDGLLADLGHVCTASGVGATVDLGAVPTHPSWNAKVTQQQQWQWALKGGDDYQLLFTVPPNKVAQLNKKGLPVQKIGCLVEGSGVSVAHLSEPMDFTADGYNHFG